MRIARILGLAAATVIVLALAAAAWLPSVLDWNRYRGTFEILASDALGRPVTIAGPISLSLLPQPVLTASRVRVGGGEDGARILVAELRLRVALMPLLSGQVDARELTLQRPDLRLPWPPRNGLPFATPPWLAALSARIEDGRIEAGALTLTDVNATLAAGRGSAALVLSGSAAMGAANWQLDLRLGYPEPNGNAPLAANLAGAGLAAGVKARLAGNLAPDGQIGGQLALSGPNLSRLMAAPPLPFRVAGTIAAAADAVRLSALTITLGTAEASGSGTLALTPGPRLNLALASTRVLPLDPWLAVLRGGGESGLPVGLTLAAPRAVLARGLLQKVRLAVVFGPGGARIGIFQALLPGDARFAAEGQLAPAPGKNAGWQFTGTAHLNAPMLGTTTHWLVATTPGMLPPLPSAVLRTADLSARITIDAGRVTLEDLGGTFDQNHLGGGISLGLGGRPAISAGLTFATLDLDPWLRPWLSGASLPGLEDLPRFFAGMSVELRLSVGRAELAHTTINALTLDAAAGPGQVTVRRLDASFSGIHAIASGTIGTGGVMAAGRLALTAPGPKALAALVPAPFGAALEHWHAPLALDVSASGPPKALQLSLDATLGDLRLTASPVIDLGSGTWQGVVTLRHPGAGAMIAALGLPNPTPWLGQGSFSLIGQVVGGVDSWHLNNFRLIAGGLTASGSFGLALGPGGPSVSGTVAANRIPMPLPAASEREPLPFALLAGWHGDIRFAAGSVLAGPRVVLRDASGRVSAADGRFLLETSGAPAGGGRLTFALAIEAGGRLPEVRLGAAFVGVHLAGGLFRTPLDLRSGSIAGEVGLTSKGYSPTALLATLQGKVGLTMADGVLSGVDLGGVRAALAGKPAGAPGALASALTGGETKFTRLALTATGSAGRFTVTKAALTAADGTIGASGTVDLPARTEDFRLALTPADEGAPEVIVRLAGPIGRPQRLIETTAALHWLAARGEPGSGH